MKNVTHTDLRKLKPQIYETVCFELLINHLSFYLLWIFVFQLHINLMTFSFVTWMKQKSHRLNHSVDLNVDQDSFEVCEVGVIKTNRVKWCCNNVRLEVGLSCRLNPEVFHDALSLFVIWSFHVKLLSSSKRISYSNLFTWESLQPCFQL